MKKSQPAEAEKLEAPIRLSPEQLEGVVAGVKAHLIQTNGDINSIIPTTTMGIIAPPPTWPGKLMTFSTLE